MSGWLDRLKHKDFLLRVAVREVEAWVLAADDSFGKFLGMRQGFQVPAPETLTDPKLELLKLASTCPRREVREALVRWDTGQNPKQGPAYNSTLVSYVNGGWQPDVAAAKCPSLRRMLNALAALEGGWKDRSQ